MNSDSWKLIQQGNEKAFEQMYRDHYRGLYALACRFLNNNGLAEEAVHDVLLRLWDQSAQIEINTSLKAYLFKSVSNHCLNLLSKKQVSKTDVTELQTLADESQVDEWLYEEELCRKLLNLLDQLPEQNRIIFKMSRFDDKKHQEIADELGLSIKTVKNNITLTLQFLRTHLKEDQLLTALLLLSFLSGQWSDC